MNYLTKQRATVLNTVKGLRTHPTAKDVFAQVKVNLPGISFATVYRNLKYLVTNGLLKEIDFADEAVRYDSFLRDHQHFICKNCTKIYDLELSKLLNVEEKVNNIPCHQVDSYRLELYGICNQCKQK